MYVHAVSLVDGEHVSIYESCCSSVKYIVKHITVKPPVSDTLDVRLRWSLTGGFTKSNLTDGGTNQGFG